MTKYISLFILIFFTFFSNLNAEVINQIIIKNNNRISIETIKTYGDIKIGIDYSSNDLNKILKNLYETNFFKNIKLDIANNVLTIDVVENKIIQTVSINGVKSEKTTEAILKDLSLKSKSSFIESFVAEDLFRIKSSLYFQGYYF